MKKEKLKLHPIQILEKDIARVDNVKIKLHKTEPRWSVIERALTALEGKMLSKYVRTD